MMKGAPKFAPEAAARVAVTLAAGEVDAALPVIRGANGATERPRYVMVSTNLQATIAFGDSGVSATSAGMFIMVPGDSQIFDVTGYTNISTLAAGAGQLIVAALTNQ